MIPVFEPTISAEDVAAVAEAVRKGEISGTYGPAIERFERDFAGYVGCKHGVAVSSGTTALHVAVAAAGIGHGDEVLVSASTNIATALAAFHNGAVAVAVDSESTTWNLDLDLLESLVTPKTRCVIPVHLFGHPVDMDRLMQVARKHDLLVIEDCAESHGATVRDRMTGSFGDMGCFSFYANKIITSGEGGMVTTSDDALAERLRLLRNLAFQTPRFYHEHAGFNFRMTGMQAALGLSQFARIDRVIADKRRIAALYSRHLEGISALQRPVEMPWARNVYWMYGIVLTDRAPLGRDALMARLKEKGIDTRTFFCPMNLQPFLQRQAGHRATACPVADRLWQQGLYLPSSSHLTEAQIITVTSAIRESLA